MKKLVWVLVAVLTFIFTPVTPVRAEQNERGLLLVEIQTGSTGSASEEFIELYYDGDQPLDLSTYTVQYFSASATNFETPSRSIALSGTLYSHGRYLLASSGYLTAQANTAFSATLAKTGGHLRLVSNNNGQLIVHDLLGWGAASVPDTTAATAPNGGESLQRKLSADGTYQDTDDNNHDFVISLIPTPESANPAPLPVEEDPTPPIDPVPDPIPELPPDPTPDIDQPSDNQEPAYEGPSQPIQITELLPNPASPQTDADDEFVELFNPNLEPVNLLGYRIETGNSYSYHFEIGDITMAANSYVVVYSRDTSLALSNAGGKARLLNPNGEVVSETSLYDAADDNLSWALLGGIWQWTTTPTPGSANIFSVPASLPTTVRPKTSTPKKATAPKKTASKVASAKTTKPKTSSSKKGGSKKYNEAADSPGTKSFLHPAILASVGLLAVGYGAYEYRESIANRLHKLRHFRKNRGETGQPS